jgi:hypothetical protein
MKSFVIGAFAPPSAGVLNLLGDEQGGIVLGHITGQSDSPASAAAPDMPEVPRWGAGNWNHFFA